MKKSISFTLAIALIVTLFACFLAFAPAALAEEAGDTAPTEPVEFTPVIFESKERNP